MLKMTDEAGPDSKILAVPGEGLTDLYGHINTADELPKSLLSEIAHFFEHYKDLESGKWVRLEGWVGPEEAQEEILSSVARFRDAPEKPNF